MASLWFCKQRSYVFYWIGHWRIADLTSRILVCFGYITSHTRNKNPLSSDAQKAYSLLSIRCLCVSHLIREAFSDQPFLKQDHILAFSLYPFPLIFQLLLSLDTFYVYFFISYYYICTYVCIMCMCYPHFTHLILFSSERAISYIYQRSYFG